MEHTNETVICPVCNVPMVDGVCPQCGMKAEDVNSASENSEESVEE